MPSDISKKLGGIVGDLKDKAERLKDGVVGAAGEVKEQVVETAGAVTEKVAELADDYRKDKEVIAFPTYGYREGGGWVIPLRVWGSEGNLDQKVEQITKIFESLPEREFVLIGDSGEKDPEVFGRIRDRFGARVRKIFIRDVVGEVGKSGSTRLEGMAVIDPEGNVVRDVEPAGFGVTRFDG